MLCRLKRSVKASIIKLIVGISIAAFCLMKEVTMVDSSPLISRFMGMMFGIGSAFAGVNAIRLIRMKISSPEKLKLEKIEQEDERNIQVTRVAYTISSLAASILLAGLIVLFTFMGSITESYICVAALLLQVGIFFMAYIYYNKKM